MAVSLSPESSSAADLGWHGEYAWCMARDSRSPGALIPPLDRRLARFSQRDY